MKNIILRSITTAVSLTLLFTTFTLSALAEWEKTSAVAWEEQAAAEYLTGDGILRGDENGNLNLDKGLTRAELAALLWRLDGMDDTGAQDNTLAVEDVSVALAEGQLRFTDVPEWAKQYVMYCKLKGLMQGYNGVTFGSGDSVSVRAVCTVILRTMGYSDGDGAWTYDTSLTKAQTVGVAPALLADTNSVRRGDMATIVYRAATGNLIPVTVPVPPDGDYSKEANPDVFDGRIFTRELYNAFRTAYLGYDNNDVRLRLYDCDEAEVQTQIYNGWTGIYGATGGGGSTMNGIKTTYSSVTVNPYIVGWQIYSLNAEATANRNAFISSLQGLSDMEKVERINQYISDHITYDVTLAGNNWNDFFTTGIVGDCDNYAHAANQLFYSAGIPCIPVRGFIQNNPAGHLANAIYISGNWEFYDAASSESLGVLILGTDGEKSVDFDPISPRLNQFAQEAVLPGSTK